MSLDYDIYHVTLEVLVVVKVPESNIYVNIEHWAAKSHVIIDSTLK